ncbi:hypothetical protein PWT90_09962 [Aphanocladium album]|nr:hypothetical protein PWT90_09962 [Aphanocladium album]
MVQQETTIANAVRECLMSFTLVPQPTKDGSVTPDYAQLAHQGDRFKLWSGNIGAHRTGSSSLEYRLRDASNIRLNVLELLGDLAELISDFGGIISGAVRPWDADMTEAVEEGAPKTELEQIVIHIRETVDSLLGLSITIRNPAPHDRFMTMSATDISFYEPHDISHVKELYSGLLPWQAQRLGAAISKRRQYFRYRRTHREKLAFGIDDDVDAGLRAPSTLASSIPSNLKDKSSLITRESQEEEQQDYMSQTSLATSVAESSTRRIPPLPEDAEYGPFECPFCFCIITAKNRMEWKRHVFEDLRPYVCVQEKCTGAEYGFAHRRDWITHTKRTHLTEYKCSAESCTWKGLNEVTFKAHIQKSHSNDISRYGTDTLLAFARVEGSEHQDLSCPLCGELQSSTKSYYRHVGRHMEQLSLFALPLNDEADADELETDGDDGDELQSLSDANEAAENDTKQALNVNQLRLAAYQGDVDTIHHMLQQDRVQNDSESTVLAARAGKVQTLILLLNFGFEPDPAPVPLLPANFATPMLAALGGDDVDVVKLLAAHPRFNPTRRVMGKTYFELAKERGGANCKEEEDILRDAYDRYASLGTKNDAVDPATATGTFEAERVEKEKEPVVMACLFPDCDAKPFKRRADLDRHYRHKHTSPFQKELFYCDYPSCKRRTDHFSRRDVLRDHLREVHHETIEKRVVTEPSTQWWRCPKCLARNYPGLDIFGCRICVADLEKTRENT